MRALALAVGIGCGVAGMPAKAADLPPHGPLKLLIVSDEVNPNNLSDAELTQPGDLLIALSDPDSGLNLVAGPDAVVEVDSQCVDEALAILGDPGAVDALVYFAHQPARGCDASDRQAELTTATAALLAAGGGVVVFHHGMYQAAGKEAILQLLGGTAGAIAWDVNDGQDVVDVAPGHFVTSNAVEYAGLVMYADMLAGVPAGDYPYFNNTPDERYPALALLSAPGEDRTILFGSGYDGSGHVLGYDLQRPEWLGRVVFYQPGEYQPNALDMLDGNNFQILANAIVHVTQADDPGDTDSDSDGCTCTPGTVYGCMDGALQVCAADCVSFEPQACDPGTECFDGSCLDDGTTISGGSQTDGATTVDPTGPGEASTDGSAMTLGESSAPGTTTPTDAGTGGATGVTSTGTGADDPGASGCGCRSDGPGGLLAGVLLLARRRRQPAVRAWAARKSVIAAR